MINTSELKFYLDGKRAQGVVGLELKLCNERVFGVLKIVDVKKGLLNQLEPISVPVIVENWNKQIVRLKTHFEITEVLPNQLRDETEE